ILMGVVVEQSTLDTSSPSSSYSSRLVEYDSLAQLRERQRPELGAGGGRNRLQVGVRVAGPAHAALAQEVQHRVRRRIRIVGRIVDRRVDESIIRVKAGDLHGPVQLAQLQQAVDLVQEVVVVVKPGQTARVDDQRGLDLAG